MWSVLRWQNIVDFSALAVFLYLILHLAREARALRTALAIVGLYAGSLVARNFDLLITSYVLEAGAFVGVGVLVLTFQSELRYVLLRLNSLFRLWPEQAGKPAQTGRAIADAAFHLAATRTGALIVVLGDDPIAGLITGGVRIGSSISAPLLEAVFQKTSPLHDGAVLIAGDRLIEAMAILPLTDRSDVPLVYGTRHRAALGLSERTDALVVVVSEERGEVTLVRSGRTQLIERAEQLAQLVHTTQLRPRARWGKRARAALFADARLKLVSAGIAALVWFMTLVATGSTIRIVSVPVEFSNVPRGLALSNQSALRISLQLRGRSWLMNSSDLTRLMVHFNLQNAKPGTQYFHIGLNNVDLPPGIVLDAASPPDVSVRVIRQGPPPKPS